MKNFIVVFFCILANNILANNQPNLTIQIVDISSITYYNGDYNDHAEVSCGGEAIQIDVDHWCSRQAFIDEFNSQLCNLNDVFFEVSFYPDSRNEYRTILDINFSNNTSSFDRVLSIYSGWGASMTITQKG